MYDTFMDFIGQIISLHLVLLSNHSLCSAVIWFHISSNQTLYACTGIKIYLSTTQCRIWLFSLKLGGVRAQTCSIWVTTELISHKKLALYFKMGMGEIRTHGSIGHQIIGWMPRPLSHATLLSANAQFCNQNMPFNEFYKETHVSWLQNVK